MDLEQVRYLEHATDVVQSHGRRGLAPKNYQLLAQDEILGIKPHSPREPRPDSKQQLDQNATIGRFITIRRPARHPG